MRAFIGAALSVLMFAGWTASAGAAESYFRDIQRILDNGKLKVAILATDAPPMIMSDEQGQLYGFEADLARDVGKKLGVPVEFVRTADTYDAVAQMVAQGEADVAVSFLSRSVERAKRVFFTVPYVTQTSRVFYNRVAWTKLRGRFKGLEDINQLPDSPAAQTIELGVLKGSVYATTVEREQPGIRLKEYERLSEMMAAVKSGDLFGGYHGEIQLAYFLRQNPEYAIHVGIDTNARDLSDISITVRPDAPNLLRWLNIYLGAHVGLLKPEDVLKRHEEQVAKQRNQDE